MVNFKIHQGKFEIEPRNVINIAYIGVDPNYALHF